MNESLKSTVEGIWIEDIRKAYENGVLCSERQLQAELYNHLKLKLNEDHCIWVEPTLELDSIGNKRTIKPDLLITKGNSIVAILEIKNVPSGEVDFKHDIGKMVDFQNCKHRTFRFHTDPMLGVYSNRQFIVDDEILCVYAAIARGDFAWAVESEKFWKTRITDFETPLNFLHLGGKTYQGKLQAWFGTL